MTARQLILWSVACLTLAGAAAIGKAPPNRQPIYALTTKQEYSNVLGVHGISSYVVLPGGSRRGLYITKMESSGQWRNFHLQPGDILLTVDNRVVLSGSSADKLLAGMTPGAKTITLGRLDEAGRPVLVTDKITFDTIYDPAILGALASSGSTTTSLGGGFNRTVTPVTDLGAPRPKENISLGELEQLMFRLVNDDRRKEGAPPVAFSNKLADLARAHAENMIKRKFFNHNDPQGRSAQDRAKEAGITCGVYENISMEQLGFFAQRDLVVNAQSLMMREPKNQHNHRYNILMPSHQYVGIGAARSENTLMLVQEFTDSSP